MSQSDTPDRIELEIDVPSWVAEEIESEAGALDYLTYDWERPAWRERP